MLSCATPPTAPCELAAPDISTLEEAISSLNELEQKLQAFQKRIASLDLRDTLIIATDRQRAISYAINAGAYIGQQLVEIGMQRFLIRKQIAANAVPQMQQQLGEAQKCLEDVRFGFRLASVQMREKMAIVELLNAQSHQ